jgi:Uma2 family endonuclease
VTVVCGDTAFSDKHRDTITNPVLLVEVLSPGTEMTDRVRKLEGYQAIPSLDEYLLVSQFKPRVELYRRQSDGSWSYHVSQGLDGRITLQSVSAELNLADVYSQIEFATSE